jgi:hypothetical protein
MATLTPEQLRTRERVERLIRLAAPGLNLMLAAGERLSRIVEPEDPEYYPARPLPGGQVEPAPPPPAPGAPPRGE